MDGVERLELTSLTNTSCQLLACLLNSGRKNLTNSGSDPKTEMQSSFTGSELKYWLQVHRLSQAFFGEFGLEGTWKLELCFMMNYSQTLRFHYGKSVFFSSG